MRRTRRWPGILKGLLLLLVVLTVLLGYSVALDHLESGQAAEGRQQLEEAIRRAAVACYAAEGRYPTDVAYLEEHYGLQIDADRYTVFYDAVAENLMPEITVLENETT